MVWFGNTVRRHLRKPVELTILVRPILLHVVRYSEYISDLETLPSGLVSKCAFSHCSVNFSPSSSTIPDGGWLGCTGTRVAGAGVPGAAAGTCSTSWGRTSAACSALAWCSINRTAVRASGPNVWRSMDTSRTNRSMLCSTEEILLQGTSPSWARRYSTSRDAISSMRSGRVSSSITSLYESWSTYSQINTPLSSTLLRLPRISMALILRKRSLDIKHLVIV